LGDRIGYVRVEHLSLAGAPPAAPVRAVSAPRRSWNGLAEAHVASAIALGSQQKGTARGLRLLGTGETWTRLVTSRGAGPVTAARFHLQIHTPLAWIQQLASDAARDNRPFGMRDVTDEMSEPVLRVTAYSDVTILRADSTAAAIQPLAKEALSVHVLDANGGKTVFEGLRLTFPMEAVRQLRGTRGDGEFFVTVIGTAGERNDIRIMKQHFADLPM
jgi:hypothetical protein